MSRLIAFLAEHGGMLALGLTCWLVLGAVMMRLARSPIHALRAGEATLLSCVIWLVLACVPLERLSMGGKWNAICRCWATAAVDASRIASTVDGSAPTVWGTDSSLAGHPTADEPVPPDPQSRGNPLSIRPVDESASSRPARNTLHPRSSPRVAVKSRSTHASASRPTATHPTATTATASRSQNIARPRPIPDRSTVSDRAPCNRGPEVTSGGSALAIEAGQEETNASDPGWLTARRLAGAYLMGCLASAVWLASGAVALRRLVRSARQPAPWLRGLYDSLTPGDARRPRLLVSDRCGRPLACGWRRPVILLPRRLCHLRRGAELRHVLRHELVHVAQRDAWGQLLFNAMLPLCYFHPLYWWLRGHAGLCRELIADDRAVADGNKREYVENLLGLARCLSPRSDARLGALGVFDSTSQFYRRMTMLLEREKPLSLTCGWRWRATLLSVGGLAVALLTMVLGLPAAIGEEESNPAVAQTVLTLFASDRDEGDKADRGESDDEDEADEFESGDGDDDSDGDESDDEEESESDQSDEEESDDEESDEDESDDEESDDEESMDDEEGDVDLLLEEKQELAQRLAELDARIEEAAANRAQRRAERAAAEAERWQGERADELNDRLEQLLESLSEMAERQDRLHESLGEMAERVEQLTQDNESLRDEIASLRERMDQGDTDGDDLAEEVDEE